MNSFARLCPQETQAEKVLISSLMKSLAVAASLILKECLLLDTALVL